MFEVFPMDFKEEVAKSLVDIAADFNFKNPKEVFPVLQITYLQMGEEKPAPEWLRHLSETCRPTEAEVLVYLFKSGNEYYYLSLSYTSEAVITDGKALGEYHEDMLKSISPDIPMVSIAYGNPEYSMDFTSVNINKLFYNPLDTQDEYGMDCFSQSHKGDINGFVKDFHA